MQDPGRACVKDGRDGKDGMKFVSEWLLYTLVGMNGLLVGGGVEKMEN